MSDSLSIAAVSATLRKLLVQGLKDDLPDEGDITTKPLDKARTDEENGKQVNLFLYHTLPNAAFTNMDMPGRVRAGETGHPPLPLNLYYLITAYGDGDDDLNGDGHRLLGRAMSVLHDHPVLSREEIKNAEPKSNLSEQVERIRITPQPLSLDEMSKLWNTFQTQYRISAAYQASVVLIESTRPARIPLPVLARGSEDQGVTTVSVPSPSLTEIKLPRGKPGAELGDQLILRGSNLSGDDLVVRFSHPLIPNDAKAHELPASLAEIVLEGKPEQVLTVHLPSLADDSQAGEEWPIGFYTIQVIVTNPTTWTTNALSLAIVPTAKLTTPARPPTPPEVFAGNVNVKLTCMPRIQQQVDQRKQVVELLFGDRVVAAKTVTTPVDKTKPSILEFTVANADVGTYLLRLRVDGVDSIPIDFTKSPPKFDPTLQIKVK